MKFAKPMIVAAALIVSGCAQAPKPVAEVAPQPVTDAAAPAQLVTPAAEPAVDPATIATAQRDLKALGYASGKSGQLADPAFQRSILAFQKDQGLSEDGRLTPATMEKLAQMRAALLKTAAASGAQNAIFAYSDGSTRRLGLLMAPPHGLISDGPANFLNPLHPGAQGVYQLGNRGKDGGFRPAMTVTCQAGKMTQTSIPLGVFDTIPVDCRGDGANPLQWRSFYSVALATVVRQETPGGTRDLVAIRPFTGEWPAAARTGLDWALTHALETASSAAPVQWSSTGVPAHFEIKTMTGKLSGQEAGLSGKNATENCRRFEMIQSGNAAPHYPGIACQNAAGAWYLPGSAVALEAPASGLATRATSPGLRSAQN